MNNKAEKLKNVPSLFMFMLELMARGGMRISEALKLTPSDIEDRKLILKDPKSGRQQEVVYVPQRTADRLKGYIRDKGIESYQSIFSITYAAARIIVKKAGRMVDIRLRSHDLRRHTATYASRSGISSEIVSKVILRHANLSTTQRYLGKVSDVEAMSLSTGLGFTKSAVLSLAVQAHALSLQRGVRRRRPLINSRCLGFLLCRIGKSHS